MMKTMTSWMKAITGRYSRQGLWSLFLICAFPLHAWTLVLGLRDFSWVTERTNSWDAIGVISYGLIFALVESVLVFLVVVLLGYLVSNKWREEQQIVLMSNLVLLTSIWAMVSQLYFMLAVSVPGSVIEYLVNLTHPVRFLYMISLVAAGVTVSLPTYMILRSNKFLQMYRGLLERLSLLTLFYLFFDVIGLIIVIIRNN
jgi:hypothetical protein